MACLIYPGPEYGTEITNCDDCYQKVDFTEGFIFPYYGNNYNSVYISSNGFLTFDFGESSTGGTILGFIAGQPRISPYWVDLFPLAAPAGGGVFYKQFPDRFVVTWVQVPYWFGAGGISPYNTFQVVLYDTGRIGFAYDDLDNTTLIDTNRYALVGVAAGYDGDSCVFKYEPPENFDPDETVDGPEGELDGNLLFFDFVDSECTMTVRSCATRGIPFTML